MVPARSARDRTRFRVGTPQNPLKCSAPHCGSAPAISPAAASVLSSSTSRLKDPLHVPLTSASGREVGIWGSSQTHSFFYILLSPSFCAGPKVKSWHVAVFDCICCNMAPRKNAQSVNAELSIVHLKNCLVNLPPTLVSLLVNVNTVCRPRCRILACPLPVLTLAIP